MYVCAWCPQKPEESVRSPGTNWSFRRLWVTLWMLGIKPETPGGAASVLNHWAIVPAPKVHPLMSFVFPQWLLVVDLLSQNNKELSWQAEVARGFPGWLWRNSVLLLVMEAGAGSYSWKAHVWEADRRLMPVPAANMKNALFPGLNFWRAPFWAAWSWGEKGGTRCFAEPS